MNQTTVQTTAKPRPPLHILIYGEPHLGKTTFACSLPAPNLIFLFDPVGKDTPYLNIPNTTVQDVQPNQWLTPIRQVVDAQGNLLYQLEYYHEADPQRPTAYKRFLMRIVRLAEEFNYWRTVTLDSLTYMEICARLNERYVLNPNAKDGRQWYSGVRETVEETIMVRFGGFPINVCIICHEKIYEDEASKQVIRGVNSVGKLSNTLSVGFSELYRIKIDIATQKRMLQTQPDFQWKASSCIHAPNPCEPNFEALWRNFG